MSFPNHPSVTNVAALMPGTSASARLAPGGSPGPVMVNQTTTNTALVPGGSYMNGA